MEAKYTHKLSTRKISRHQISVCSVHDKFFIPFGPEHVDVVEEGQSSGSIEIFVAACACSGTRTEVRGAKHWAQNVNIVKHANAHVCTCDVKLDLKL